MDVRTPVDAEILKRHVSQLAELKALRTLKRGRERLLLEVSSTPPEYLLSDGDYGRRYRVSEYDSEAELLCAFERAAHALTH